MKITFPKEPQYYDFQNTPHYFSACNKYRLLHFRSGFVNRKSGKCTHDFWSVQFNTSSGKDLNWKNSITVASPFGSRKKAIKAANEHDLFLRAEKAVVKKMKGKKRG